MKRILSAFISLWVIFTFTVTAYGEGFSEDMRWLYSVNQDGKTATITVGTMSVSQSDGLVEIPEVIDGYTVTGIGPRCFMEEAGLFTVFVPHTVTDIGDYAFQRCYGLNCVLLENGIKNIGNYTFSQCYGLLEILLPSGLVSIGDGAFESCSGLFEISIPDGTERIGKKAFSGCTGLQMVFIPASVTELGDGIFDGCPSNLTVFYEGSGSDWAKVKKNEADFSDIRLNISGVPVENQVELPDYMPYGEHGDYLYKIRTDGTVAINSYSGNDKEYVEIPSEIAGCPVTAIADSTFQYNRDIKEVVIPDSVVYIGEHAFDNCKNLEKVTIGKNVRDIGKYAFAYCNRLERIEIPYGVTILEDYLFYNDYCLEEIVIPDSVAEIHNRAFSSCSDIETVYYTGSQEQWECIHIESENRYVKNSRIVYNYDPATYKPAGSMTAIILCCVAVLVPVAVIVIVAMNRKPRCPQCNAELEDKARFCTQCGKEL